MLLPSNVTKTWLKLRSCMMAVYNDRLGWSCIKSYGLFILALRYAKNLSVLHATKCEVF
ncbi:PREDICTED: uncharacterized protein LOC108619854 [Drosophila arizonae]|uniref:Uncharacterized protein LOC108619854 n=1 Tax=Drosophila arizonae TaxID=7263 RepID=A0ABM1PY53_DROAR|nr:PREDICTED: uncharacterized protein LOC108619854 [Drosophila arizonae]